MTDVLILWARGGVLLAALAMTVGSDDDAPDAEPMASVA